MDAATALDGQPLQPNVTPTGTMGLRLRNGSAVSVDQVPVLSVDEFARAAVEACHLGGRLVALASLPITEAHRSILAVVAYDAASMLQVMTAHVDEGVYPSLTPRLPQAQAFERELFESHGLRPEAHPWLKPLRQHPELGAIAGPPFRIYPHHENTRRATDGAPVSHPFLVVDGAGIHEVAVGPVHAGIIEPGHFRFQCAGEEVLHLEIHLGYQHRGAEALLLMAPGARRMAVAESIAGDTVIGHGLAHCMALEALSRTKVPPRAQVIRAVALELERLANHVGDLGALSGDVGYLPGAAYFGRLRGDFLNMMMMISGNRFGRALLQPGGIRFDLPGDMRHRWIRELERAEQELRSVAALLFETPSVVARFEGTGTLTRAVAEELGLVGPVARACGLERDVRKDHPTGAYCETGVPVATTDTGDVMGRAMVRWLEIQHSLAFIKAQLDNLPDGALTAPARPLSGGQLAVAMVEGWRGEIVHLALTSASGAMIGYKVIDPSFHNWFGLAMALRGNQISDFPLCNKSFNLSYAGHDL